MRPMILPVIHHTDEAQALRNAERAFEAGCEGVMLISMDAKNLDLPNAGWAIKNRWPDRLVGLNFLGATDQQLPLFNVGSGFDMTWTDEQLTHSAGAPWPTATLANRLLASLTHHRLFCGVAFKYQPEEPDPAFAAVKAVELGLIPTMSGPATGQEADPYQIEAVREAMVDAAPLALASGVTPDNAHRYLPHLSHVLVSTGVSASFHEFDPAKLRALVEVRG